MQNKTSCVRITLRSTGTLVAEGSRGWDMMPFEGNFYVRARCLKTGFFRLSLIPGICPYKGLYFWMDLRLTNKPAVRSLAWCYWLRNPLFPFIWFRVALSAVQPDLLVEEYVRSPSRKT